MPDSLTALWRALSVLTLLLLAQGSFATLRSSAFGGGFAPLCGYGTDDRGGGFALLCGYGTDDRCGGAGATAQ